MSNHSSRRHPSVRKNPLLVHKYQIDSTPKNQEVQEGIEDYREALNTEWVDTEDKNKEDNNE